jgi:hypothetical protein
VIRWARRMFLLWQLRRSCWRCGHLKLPTKFVYCGICRSFFRAQREWGLYP